RDIDFDGRFLGALCQDKRGGWQDSGLDVKGCKHDQVIGAKDGLLVCLRVPGGREPPAGSYRDSCRGVEFDGRFVSGECRGAEGAGQKASLDMRTCKDGADMLNDDGEIVCKVPPPPAPPAPPVVAPRVTAATPPSAAAPPSPPAPAPASTQTAPVT